jgi:GNAT superfamily N-acetyltransferase
MKSTDLPAISALADEAHPSFPEEPSIFAEKQRLFEAFCFSLEFEDMIAGYCIAHPWMRDSVPALNRLLHASLPAPDCLFIHDVVVAPMARGKGATAALIDLLESAARRHGLKAITLVSLYGSNRLWRRYDFTAIPIPDRELKSYGTTAIYMQKSLS